MPSTRPSRISLATVALKVIKPGLAGPELLRRFAQEAQALGRLQHPGIAQIYDAGADTAAARSHARDGVHPRRVAARIRRQPSSGPPRAARADGQDLRGRCTTRINAASFTATSSPATSSSTRRASRRSSTSASRGLPTAIRATLQTDVGQLVGTLNYMSPEQVLADPLDIDTRSDVYALGVISTSCCPDGCRIRSASGCTRRCRRSARGSVEAEHDRSPLPRRHRDDCGQGAREGQDAALFLGSGTGGGHHALPEGRTNRRAAADHQLPAAEVCPPAQGTGWRGGGRFVVLAAGVVVNVAGDSSQPRRTRGGAGARSCRGPSAWPSSSAIVPPLLNDPRRRRATTRWPRGRRRCRGRAGDRGARSRGCGEAARRHRVGDGKGRERVPPEEPLRAGDGRHRSRGGAGPQCQRCASIERRRGSTARSSVSRWSRRVFAKRLVLRMWLSLWDKAMAQFDRAVAIRRREQGDEDADTLKALRQLVAIDANLRRGACRSAHAAGARSARPEVRSRSRGYAAVRSTSRAST